MDPVIYASASSVGWLDLDAAASERVAELLRALEEPGTLDPLGLGTVRDAFSAMLVPGTSTVQTRVRYFVFLPWIFKLLEAERVAPGAFAGRLRHHEARLIDCLRHLGRNEGVIGFRAGRKVVRLPSEIYWGGLGAWGVRRYDLSLSEYGKRVTAFGRRGTDRDDDGNATGPASSMWVPLPEPPEGFLNEPIDFDLTAEEATFLVDRIRQRQPGSLLATMCSRPYEAAEADFPWDLRGPALSAELNDVLRHAQCFSELTVGPQHVYNVLLARQARAELQWDTTALEESELARLAEWTGMLADRGPELQAWADELDSFWSLVGSQGHIPDATRAFIERVVQRALADPGTFAEDAAVHALLRERELRLKTKRARLANRSALEAWNQAPFGGQLSFRWPIARSYLADIAAGLARIA